MYYLCLAFTVVWSVYFIYLFYLHRQMRDIAKRLEARGK